MRLQSSDCFHFRLPGGLGNQLFGLFASRYISQITGLINHLDFDGVDYSHTNLRSDLRSFDLDSREQEVCKKGNIVNWYLQFLKKSSALLKLNESSILNWMGIAQFPILRDSKLDLDDFLSTQLNSDRRFFVLRIIDSYMADFAFFDALQPVRKLPLQLKNPSDRFSRLVTNMQLKNTIAVHLRLGDFLENRSSIGLLGDEYFIKAISKLAESGEFEKVLVFSDSTSLALHRISGWNGSLPIEVVESTPMDDPAEDLKLMSACGGIVCSNSTFSFWAAKLASGSDPQTPVVVPSSFRKDHAASVKSIPLGWHLESPFWV